ncbi:P2Y purinoceptor 2-like [Megalops cyprinoides]|uniref:P2Y purinoceptor 2-like n=1 Tax=Megalops cyprinoides TaxID=118141 RepID=UPI001863CFD3|nr:P2Y purinoceptor 2-like [Megalops cyprinoides]
MAALNDSSEANESSPYRCQFDEDFKYILLPVSYGLVFLVGLVLNVLAMYVIVFRTKRWKSSTIYMFNLTVCDTLYILTLPFLIYYYADENDWPFSEPFCKVIRFLFYANLYGSILFLCCISLHRFLGVCYPMRSLRWASARHARLVSVGVWVTVVGFQAPVLYFSRTREFGDEKTCYDTTSEELFDDFLVYSSVISVLLFCVPFMVVMVCYGLMVRKLLEPTAGGASSLRSKQKSVKMIVIVLAAFMLCFLPFHLTRSLYYSFRYLDERISCDLLEASSMAYKVTRPLASANSCLDPILYFLAGQGFRSNLMVTKKNRQTRRAGTVKSSTTQL